MTVLDFIIKNLEFKSSENNMEVISQALILQKQMIRKAQEYALIHSNDATNKSLDEFYNDYYLELLSK